MTSSLLSHLPYFTARVHEAECYVTTKVNPKQQYREDSMVCMMFKLPGLQVADERMQMSARRIQLFLHLLCLHIKTVECCYITSRC